MIGSRAPLSVTMMVPDPTSYPSRTERTADSTRALANGALSISSTIPSPGPTSTETSPLSSEPADASFRIPGI